MLVSACGDQDATTAASKANANTTSLFASAAKLNEQSVSQAPAVEGVSSTTAAYGTLSSQSAQAIPTVTTIQNALGVYQPRVLLPMPLVYTGNLPDTGITASQCYGAGSNALISCTSVAALALDPQQDGMIGRDVTSPLSTDGQLGFSYSTVANSMGGTHDKTECVKDNITGLIWEGKTTSGAHSKWLVYNFSQTPTFVSEVNASNLCGFDDWRLPTAVELQSLVDFSVVSGDPAVLSPAIDRTWFPNTQDSHYLSTSTSLSGNPLIVSFSDGATRASDGAYVRLVRGAQITTSFVVSQDGQEVTDTKAGLIWRRCAEGATFDGTTCVGSTEAGGTSYLHEPAFARAKAQAISTGLPWRLPNVKELTNLSANFVTYTGAFPEQPEYLWSSTPQTGDSYSAWVVSKYGGVEAPLGNRTVYTFYRMRLVRNAP